MTDYLEEREKWLENTLTVEELISLLKNYPGNMKVFTIWESTIQEITPECVYESITGSLYIDADACRYKDEYAEDPNENESGNDKSFDPSKPCCEGMENLKNDKLPPQ